MICNKAGLTKRRNTFINASTSHFGLNIPTLHEEQTIALLRMYERIQTRKKQNLHILQHEITQLQEHVNNLHDIKAIEKAPYESPLTYLILGLAKYNMQFQVLSDINNNTAPQSNSCIYNTPVHMHPLAVALDKAHPRTYNTFEKLTQRFNNDKTTLSPLRIHQDEHNNDINRLTPSPIIRQVSDDSDIHPNTNKPLLIGTDGGDTQTTDELRILSSSVIIKNQETDEYAKPDPQIMEALGYLPEPDCLQQPQYYYKCIHHTALLEADSTIAEQRALNMALTLPYNLVIYSDSQNAITNYNKVQHKHNLQSKLSEHLKHQRAKYCTTDVRKCRGHHDETNPKHEKQAKFITQLNNWADHHATPAEYNKVTHWMPASFAPTILSPTITFYIACCNIGINNSIAFIQKQRQELNNHIIFNYRKHAWRQEIRTIVTEGNQYTNWMKHKYSSFLLQYMANDLPTPSVIAQRQSTEGLCPKCNEKADLVHFAFDTCTHEYLSHDHDIIIQSTRHMIRGAPLITPTTNLDNSMVEPTVKDAYVAIKTQFSHLTQHCRLISSFHHAIQEHETPLYIIKSSTAKHLIVGTMDNLNAAHLLAHIISNHQDDIQQLHDGDVTPDIEPLQLSAATCQYIYGSISNHILNVGANVPPITPPQPHLVLQDLPALAITLLYKKWRAYNDDIPHQPTKVKLRKRKRQATNEFFQIDNCTSKCPACHAQAHPEIGTCSTHGFRRHQIKASHTQQRLAKKIACNITTEERQIHNIKKDTKLTKQQNHLLTSKLNQYIKPEDLQSQPFIIDNDDAQSHKNYHDRPFIDLHTRKAVKQLYDKDDYRVSLSKQLNCFNKEHTIIQTIQAIQNSITPQTTKLIYRIKTKYYNKNVIVYPYHFKCNVVALIQNRIVGRETILGKRKLRAAEKNSNHPT